MYGVLRIGCRYEESYGAAARLNVLQGCLSHLRSVTSFATATLGLVDTYDDRERGKSQTYGLIRVVAQRIFRNMAEHYLQRISEYAFSGTRFHLCLLGIANQPQCC